MVSEFMLQQTPVVRVLPVHEAWLERWPTPASLAADASGEADGLGVALGVGFGVGTGPDTGGKATGIGSP